MAESTALQTFFEHPDVRWNDDGSVTVKLSRPVVRPGERIEAITMRRVRVKDMRGIDLNRIGEGFVDSLQTLVARLSGLSVDEVGELEFADFDLIAPQIRRLQTRAPEGSARAAG